MRNLNLVRLHRYNGWNLFLLLVTGVLLYMPALRGALAPVRTALKYLHLLSGLISVLLLLAYLPQARGHWGRLRSRIGQKANVVLLASLLLGWAATGLGLWLNRYLPPNRDAVVQILFNLLDNACKYTPEGSWVRVGVTARGEVTVCNGGPGISPTDLPNIFERFYRADKSRSRETGGAGIGLAIV